MKKQPDRINVIFVSRITKYAFTLISVFFAGTVMAAQKPLINLDSLYRRLDEAIDSSAYYVNIRQQHINRISSQLHEAPSLREQYRLSFLLYKEYKSFKNDSALVYISRCIDIATTLEEHKRVNDCRARLAYQCSATGFYHEAYELLNSIDRHRHA